MVEIITFHHMKAKGERRKAKGERRKAQMSTQHPASSTVLVCPMEWGLGHTVRLVPVIEQALSLGWQVILGADGMALDFLRDRFPALPWVRIPFYPVRYAATRRFFLTLLSQLPGIIRAVRHNRNQLKALVTEKKIDLVITDHRYGMTHPDIPTVFITNQLWLKAPKGLSWGEPLVYSIHKRILRKFTQIWIADFAEAPGLTGKLTHPRKLPKQAHYVDPISRLGTIEPKDPGWGPVDQLAIISGPEPQRTLLEREVSGLFKTLPGRSVILKGKPSSGHLIEKPSSSTVPKASSEIIECAHAPDETIAWLLKNARTIVCRPGNSSLSDLLTLGRTALLVPTPGQTEQEYVAQSLTERGYFLSCQQGKLTQRKMDELMKFQPKSFPMPYAEGWRGQMKRATEGAP